MAAHERTFAVDAADRRPDAPRWRVVAAVLLAACACKAHAQVLPRDDRSAVLTASPAPQRIVSLLPSLTESVCALGACARLVGTDRASNWPASVRGLPKLGGLDDPQIERIVALRPDLVLLSSASRLADRLEALGVKVQVLEPRNRAEVKRSLVVLAQWLDAPAAAERVWSRIERETRAAAERVPAALRGQPVYFEVDASLYAAGPASFIGETLARLGVASALPDALGLFPKLSPEYVVRLQPGIVMAAQRDLADMTKRPGWSALRALEQGRTCGFTSEHFELLVRPGPRLGEAAGLIADCLTAIASRDAARIALGAANAHATDRPR